MANDDIADLERSEIDMERRAERISADTATVMRAVMRAVSVRAQAVLCMVLVFSLACWAMAAPDLLRVLIAAGFAVFSLCAQAVLAWGER